jgi:hypothetical protein
VSREVLLLQLGEIIQFPRLVEERLLGAVEAEDDEEAFVGTLIGSRALAAYNDVDGPSAANNRLWSRK